MILTCRYRLKETSGAAQQLSRQARAVNLVWNFCGETQETARRWNRLSPGGFDLISLTQGSSRDLGLHSDTVQAVCKQFAHSRDMHRRRAKIANCRKHFLHELTSRLVRENRRIVVGRLNAARLARTSLAKSVLDASWSQLRSQLRYKAIRHGAEYIEVDERFTTQVCSGCGALGGPQGREGLVVREWICSECGVRHDRDINSAINILLSGRNAGLQLTEIPAP